MPAWRTPFARARCKRGSTHGNTRWWRLAAPGPLHGAEVAAELDIAEVIIPPYPGITSAVGLLTTDHKYDAIKTEFQIQGDIDMERLNRDFDAMQGNLRKQFEAEGLSEDEMKFERAGDFRYAGQGYELRIDFPDGKVDEALMTQVFERFHDLHLGEYGQNYPDSPVELVNARVTGVGQMPKIQAEVVDESTERSLDAALVRRDSTMFQGGRLASDVRDPLLSPGSTPSQRGNLRSGDRFAKGHHDGGAADLYL